ncbi:hypothetical protein XA68_15084 [Ophiocordyceps unilateralis]|uniref:Uracil-DNA glycosylase-like domain-containing protein n=1 Tax=Ophiocordyceps unilateralis TaxID=268505 RepID=A0A2A9PMK4_OPHUN|nr:hypothetical protein XA68_15084 [Ophiocordyceps unilateralis]
MAEASESSKTGFSLERFRYSGDDGWSRGGDGPAPEGDADTVGDDGSGSSPPPSSTRRRRRRGGGGGGGGKSRRLSASSKPELPLLPDRLCSNLLVLLVGLNPGISTSIQGHAYAHASNLFWKLLHESGMTPRICLPYEDELVPQLFSLGLTNIVARPTRSGADLSRQELDRGVEALEQKVSRWRPEVVCLVGKAIGDSLWRVRFRRHRSPRRCHPSSSAGPVVEKFSYGWQHPAIRFGAVEGVWSGARLFVASSTSGLAASLSFREKLSIWTELGDWVRMRREEREAASAT